MTATLTMLGLAWETDFILAVFGATTLGGTPAFGTTFGGADAVFDEAAPTLFDIAVTLSHPFLFGYLHPFSCWPDTGINQFFFS
jgi:hypothetical protein